MITSEYISKQNSQRLSSALGFKLDVDESLVPRVKMHHKNRSYFKSNKSDSIKIENSDSNMKMKNISKIKKLQKL